MHEGGQDRVPSTVHCSGHLHMAQQLHEEHVGYDRAGELGGGGGGGGERVRKEWNKEGDERNEGSREGKRIGRENRT